MTSQNPVAPTILLVDDEAEYRSALARHLIKHGFEVLEAADAPSAYRILEERRERLGSASVEAIVSDWMMPGGDGVALLSEVRRSPHHAIPFVLVSGNVGRQELESAIRLDCDAVMLKPFQSSDLVKKIREAAMLREAKQIRSQLKRRA